MEHKKCCFISQRAMEFSLGLDEDDSRCIATKAHIKEVMEFANSHHVEIIQIKADSFPVDG